MYFIMEEVAELMLEFYCGEILEIRGFIRFLENNLRRKEYGIC